MSHTGNGDRSDHIGRSERGRQPVQAFDTSAYALKSVFSLRPDSGADRIQAFVQVGQCGLRELTRLTLEPPNPSRPHENNENALTDEEYGKSYEALSPEK